MNIDLNQFRQLYLQESAEHVAGMESGLLALRDTPGDHDLLHAIFRSAHSIKGGAGSFGLTSVVRFTHTLENLLDRLRDGLLPVDAAVIDALLEATDCMHELLSAPETAPLSAHATSVLHTLESFTDAPAIPPAPADAVADAAAACVPPSPAVPAHTLFHICFKPSLHILQSGTDPLLLLRNLAALGTLRVLELDTQALPPLDAVDCTCFYLAWSLALETEAPASAVEEVFEFVGHLAEVAIEQVLPIVQPVQDDVSTTPAPEFAPHDEPPHDPPTTAAESSPASTQASPTAKTAPAESSIRVPIDKVDRLIDLAGELVIAQAMAEQMARNFTPEMASQLSEALAGLARNTRQLHEGVMSIRMLPIGSLFRRYTRTVYDIGKSTGKQLRIEFSGEETEIDKSMLELLADPMIHLIRNAADHGIEPPAQRTAAGKSAEGTIFLRASHRSGKVLIEIEDDGAGIDPAKVRAKAVQRGLIAPHAELNDAQLRMLIFEAGFSTRDEVSDLSGRGVGMDVVKRNIQQMNGSVRLESTVGQGSRITIELPLTLTIMEGLVIRVCDRKLVLPLLSVIETVAVDPARLIRIADAGEAFSLRGQTMPVLRLSSYLRLSQAAMQSGPALLVVVDGGSHKLGLLIDEVLGQQQVVLKSLERHLHRIDGLMGATILADGRVAPILDVAALTDIHPPPGTSHVVPPLPEIAA